MRPTVGQQQALCMRVAACVRVAATLDGRFGRGNGRAGRDGQGTAAGVERQTRVQESLRLKGAATKQGVIWARSM